MGFGTVAANMLFFIAILTLSAGVIFYMNSFASDTTAAMTVQNNRLSDELRTDINIDSATYDNDTQTTTIYVKNTGKTKLDINGSDVYLDKDRIPRTNYTAEITSDSLVGSSDVWEPLELLEIVVEDYELTDNSIKVRVVTYNGVSAEYLLTY